MAIETTSQVAEIRAAASVLIERMQFMRQHGISFAGMRDLYDILGYDRVISTRQYRERYLRGGIAARVVEAMPKATWRGGVELIEDENPKRSTAFEKAWDELNTRLKIESVLLKTDILAGQGRYAVLLIGAGGPLDQPLKKGKPESLLYLTPFSEEDAKIQDWDTNANSERFGLPSSYLLSRLSANSLNLTSGTVSFASRDLEKPVHWTRIIHVAEGTLDNEVYGLPALERIWNLLDDLDKVTGGGAEAFWLRANQGLQLNVDKDMTISEPEKEELRKQADEYSNQMRRMLRTRGVEVNTLGSDVANFANPADAILIQIAGAKGIPKRILTGSEMGELASSQDRDNWKDQINGRQAQHAGPNMLRPLADRFIKYGFLPTPKKGPDAYQVKFAHMQTMTEQEKAEGAAKWATTATAEGPVFNRDEIRDKWYGMEPLPKPVVDAETGEHTAPGSGLPVDPSVDPETGLPLKKAPDPTVAIDPETGLPVEVDTKLGLPKHIVDENGEAPEKSSDGTPKLLPFKMKKGVKPVVKTAGGVGSGIKGHTTPRDQTARESVGQNGGDGVEWQQPLDENGRPIPIKVATVEEAVKLIHEGKVVEVTDAATAFTLIQELTKISTEAAAAGAKAKNYDLCQVSVAGTNMFCAASLRSKEFPKGVDRLSMPQIAGEAVPGSDAAKLKPSDENPNEVDGTEQFLKHLNSLDPPVGSRLIKREDKDHKTASTLRASQAELKGQTVAGMMNNKEFDPGKKPIFISRDGYIVDGHHRWAAVVGRDAADNKLGDAAMNVIQIDANISEIIHLANAWSVKFGIKPKAADKPKQEPKGTPKILPAAPKAASEYFVTAGGKNSGRYPKGSGGEAKISTPVDIGNLPPPPRGPYDYGNPAPNPSIGPISKMVLNHDMIIDVASANTALIQSFNDAGLKTPEGLRIVKNNTMAWMNVDAMGMYEQVYSNSKGERVINAPRISLAPNTMKHYESAAAKGLKDLTTDEAQAVQTLVHEMHHSVSPLASVEEYRAEHGAYLEEGINEMRTRQIMRKLTGKASDASYDHTTRGFEDIERRLGPNALESVWKESTTERRVKVMRTLVSQMSEKALVENGVSPSDATSATKRFGDKMIYANIGGMMLEMYDEDYSMKPKTGADALALFNEDVQRSRVNLEPSFKRTREEIARDSRKKKAEKAWNRW